jgi:drug/metabolite transporter (DMT)-like permease
VTPPPPDAAGHPARRPELIGALWIGFTVLVWAAWPSYTRLAVTEAVTPEDLVLLRYGIGGLLLLPVLLRERRRMPAHGWREGVFLAFFQGAPLGLLAVTGLRHAPAAHMAALSPGLMPLFTSLLAFALLGERFSRLRIGGLLLIACGGLAIAGASLAALGNGHWRGDALFVCAGLMGSIYLLRMRRSGLSAVQGAALISVYSMILYVPLFLWLWLGETRLTAVPLSDLFFQAFYQGVLMGAVTLFSLGQAVVLLGAVVTAACLSLLPVLAAVLGVLILGEWLSVADTAGILFISLGALLATGILQRRRRPVAGEPSRPME